MVARGVAWPQGDLLAAHMALNLGGWFGAAIVGTLHTFYPSLTRTVLRHPRLQPWTFAAWTAGVTSLAAGYAWSADGVVVCGWLALTAAATMLSANLIASVRASPPPMTLAARIVGLGQPFLVAGLAGLHGGERRARGPRWRSRATAGPRSRPCWWSVGSGSRSPARSCTCSRSCSASATSRARCPRRGRASSVRSRGRSRQRSPALALAQLAGADGLRAAAALLVVGAYAILGLRIAGLGARVIARARPSV